MSESAPEAALPRRVLIQPFPQSHDGRWHPTLPELACVANAVSLTMPYVEPFVIRAVGATLPLLDDGLGERTRGYLDQETAHQRVHRDFNRPLLSRSTAARRVDRATRWVFTRLRRHSPSWFGLAFAAGAEALAYLTARWVADHQGELLGGAETWAGEFFLWHLAEEVEHKDVARAVFDRVDGSRRHYAVGTMAALAVLGAASIAGTTVLLWDERRLHRPTSWFRLVRWGFGYTFDMLPSLGASISRTHRPQDFVDPAWFGIYLSRFPEEPGHRLIHDVRNPTG